MTTKQAIIVIYADGQNGPSRPLEKLFDIPDDPSERKAMLTSLFVERAITLGEGETVDDVNITITETPGQFEYGHITVADDEGVYMYVTFIEPS